MAEVVRFNSDEYGNDADNSIEPELKDATKSREIGTQCCVGARYVITKTVATQTEPWQLVNDKIVSEIGVQVDSIQENPEDSTRQHKMNVQCAAGLKQKFFDHCYPSDVEPQSDPFSSPLASCTDESDYESSDGAQSSSSCSTNSEVDLETQDEQKYIIFKSCLSLLLRHCPSCGSTVYNCQESTSGSMLSVLIFCVNGHEISWNSQPLINRMPAGNLLASAAILFSGNTFSRISQLASFLNLKFFSHTTFYDIQKKYLIPVVNEAWAEHKRGILNATQEEEPVNVISDGRSDSPGHSAKYGTYTMMSDAGKVLTFNIVQVTEVTSSNAMEKEGFERCFNELRDEGVHINRIATDRHTSISSTMDKNHQDTIHQYDVWHLSKWIIKKLTKKAQVKSCEELKPWIRSVSNHLWWCSATCEGSVDLLQEKWKSILHHVTNKHSWTGRT